MSRIVDYWSASTDYLIRHIGDETYVVMDGRICYGPDSLELCMAHARHIIESTAFGRHRIAIGFCDTPVSDGDSVDRLDYHVMFSCDFIGG